MDTIAQLQQHLHTFRQLQRPGSLRYEWAHAHDGGRHGRTVVFQAITHGDEVGPLPAMLDVMAGLADGTHRFGGRARFVLGNPEAALQGTRFVEQDLNRVFVDPGIAIGGPNAHEVKRAQALMPILDEAELFIDFHQTSQPSARPFYSYPWRRDWADWTQALGGSTAWTTRPASAAFIEGMRCTDEYVRDNGGMGITLELGQRGFSQATFARARAEMLRAMALLDDIADGRTTVADAAAEQPPPTLFAVVHIQPFSDPRMALKPGWVSFAPVRAGQRLSAPGTPEVIAPDSGEILFPVYPKRQTDGCATAPWPQTLFRIIQHVTTDPAVTFAAT